MRLILLIALACTASFAPPAQPEYEPLEFSEMAMAADLIVHGKIATLTKDSFELKIDAILHGELTTESQKTRRVHVERFANWTCASRWHEYAPGQEVVLFLRTPAAGKKLFQIMSGGGEGEMFITHGPTRELDSDLKPTGPDTRVVSVRGLGTESLDEVKNHRIGHLAQATQPGTFRQTKLADLAHAIRELHKCFEIESSKNESGLVTRKVTRIVSESRVDKLKVSSKVAALLVADASALLPR